MAEPDLPESIILGAFDGIRNTVNRERLSPADLEAAVNVDIDDAKQLRRRRGQTKVHSASHHSAFKARIGHVVVRDGVLGLLGTDYTHEPLATVGSDPLDYAEVGDVLFYASRTVSGKIVDGENLPWGRQGGGSEWLSPVIAPTDTLGAVNGKILKAPPIASIIEAHKGRMFLGDGRLIWVTELYLYDKVDATRGWIPLEHDLTMLASVEAGLLVGTKGGLMMLSGSQAKGWKVTNISRSPVIRGSAVRVPSEVAHPAARESVVPMGNAWMFLTSDGICAAFDDGQVYNLTEKRMQFPDGQNAAAMFREQDGMAQYVASVNSGGTPAGNMAIGDHIDAEIRRRSP